MLIQHQTIESLAFKLPANANGSFLLWSGEHNSHFLPKKIWNTDSPNHSVHFQYTMVHPRWLIRDTTNEASVLHNKGKKVAFTNTDLYSCAYIPMYFYRYVLKNDISRCSVIYGIGDCGYPAWVAPEPFTHWISFRFFELFNIIHRRRGIFNSITIFLWETFFEKHFQSFPHVFLDKAMILNPSLLLEDFHRYYFCTKSSLQQPVYIK